jgi:acyl carrier protein
MADDVKSRVINVVADILKIDVASIADESRFVEDLGAESMQGVELIAAFEEEFDIEMDEQGALDVKTIGTAVEFISKHL